MVRLFTKAAPPRCAQSASDLQLYEVYRSYIVHEDNLINNRVGWFIQLHSFLIATYGIVVTAIIASFFSDDQPRIGPVPPQAVACVLLIGISFIGLRSSQAAQQSILAADAAIRKLTGSWADVLLARGGGTLLLGLIGGGDPRSDKLGARFHLMLPGSLRGLWIVSYLVPLCFVGIGLYEQFHRLPVMAKAPVGMAPASPGETSADAPGQGGRAARR